MDVLPVAGRIEVVRRIPGQPRARAHRDAAEFFERRHMWFHEAERAFVECGIDDLALAGRVPRFERKQRAECRVQARNVIGRRCGDAAGRTVGVTGDVAQSADCFADHAVAGPLAIRAGLPVAADADHDQAGVDCRQVGIAQPPRFKRSRPEVLDQKITFGGETPDDRLSPWFAQIDADQRLVAENTRGPQRFAVVTLAHRAHRVAVGRFDLDHLGAEIGKETAAERPGDGRPQFEHPIAGERAVAWLLHGFCAHRAGSTRQNAESARGTHASCGCWRAAGSPPRAHRLYASRRAPPGAVSIRQRRVPAG